jgi:hypothetical protein
MVNPTSSIPFLQSSHFQTPRSVNACPSQIDNHDLLRQFGFRIFGFTPLVFLQSTLLPKYTNLHHVSFWIQWSRSTLSFTTSQSFHFAPHENLPELLPPGLSRSISMYLPLDLRSRWTSGFIDSGDLTQSQIKKSKNMNSKGLQGLTSLHLFEI